MIKPSTHHSSCGEPYLSTSPYKLICIGIRSGIFARMSPKSATGNGAQTAATPIHIRIRGDTGSGFGLCRFIFLSIERKLHATAQEMTACATIGRIRIFEIRPAPVCLVASSAGIAEPESMNCPGILRASISCRTSFHKSGASGHSSISRGASPSSAAAGFKTASRRFCA